MQRCRDAEGRGVGVGGTAEIGLSPACSFWGKRKARRGAVLFPFEGFPLIRPNKKRASSPLVGGLRHSSRGCRWSLAMPSSRPMPRDIWRSRGTPSFGLDEVRLMALSWVAVTEHRIFLS